MKYLLIILVGLATSTLTYSQNSQKIKETIDSHILDGTYESIEGDWTGPITISFYIDKNLISTSSPPENKAILFYKENGVLKCGMPELKITDGRNGSYIIYFPLPGYEFVNGAMRQTGDYLKIITQYNKLEQGVYVSIFQEWTLTKSYPLSEDFDRVRAKESERKKSEIENLPRTGTGFALSSNGLLVTNHHVIEKANSISVRGINGDFTKSYLAEIIKSDESADLAILKIIDPSFDNLGKVPFTIYNDNIDVGEDVFSLGYPLTQTMGEEIKLTTGVISANSGFQGNKNQYQISVPLQPGNSGGPLFDKNGRVVGIVNSKHTNTDNVSYAIKAKNLLGLLYLIPDTPPLNINLLNGKTLPEKVRQAKSFIYIIEVNK